jgi:hypothetical protein
MLFLLDGALLALAVLLHVRLGNAARRARIDAGAREHGESLARGLHTSSDDGEGRADVAAAPREIEEPGPPRLVAWGSGVLALGPGSLLAFSPGLMSLDQELFCGAGDVMIEVGCGEGSCVQCQAHPDSGVLFHYLGAMALAMATVVLLGLTITAFRRRASAAG